MGDGGANRERKTRGELAVELAFCGWNVPWSNNEVVAREEKKKREEREEDVRTTTTKKIMMKAKMKRKKGDGTRGRGTLDLSPEPMCALDVNLGG